MSDYDGLVPRITDEQLGALDLSAGRIDLLEGIMTTVAPEKLEPALQSPRRRTWLAGAAAAIAVLAAVTVPSFMSPDRDKAVDEAPVGGPSSAGSEGSGSEEFRVVLTAAGWKVTNVDEDASDGQVRGGGVSYERDGGRLEIHWYPASTYDSFVADRMTDLGQPQAIELLGQPAQLWSYGTHDFEVMAPAEGRFFLGVRATGATRPELGSLFGQLLRVDDQGFAAAMGGAAVGPGGRAAAVAEILSDVPTPPGLDPNPSVAGFLDRYHLVAQTTMLVACGWAKEYDDAVASGDGEARDEAVAAMATSRDWHALRDIKADGDWSESIWGVADEMKSGGTGIQERYCQ